MIACGFPLSKPVRAQDFVAGGFLDATVAPPIAMGVSTGRVTMPAGISIVSKAGYSAHGSAATINAFNDRLNLSLVTTSGSKLEPSSAAASPFSDPVGTRGFSLSSELIRRPEIRLSISGSGVETGAGSSPASEWRMDRVGDFAGGGGFDLELWRGRLSWGSELGWSRNRDTERNKEGYAQKHRFNVTLFESDGIGLKSSASLRRVSPGYVAPYGDAAANQQRLDLGSTFSAGPLSFSIKRQQDRSNIARDTSLETRRSLTDRGEFKASLEEYRPDTEKFSVFLLLPSEIKASTSRTRTRIAPAAANAEDGTKMERASSYGLTLDWSYGRWLSRLDVQSDRDRRPGVDMRGESLALIQQFEREGWKSQVRFEAAQSTTTEAGERRTEQTFGFGGKLDLNLRRGPDFVTSFGLDHTRESSEGSVDTGIGWNFDLSLDFSKYLPSPTRDHEPYLYFGVDLDGGEDADNSRLLDFTIGIRGGYRF